MSFVNFLKGFLKIALGYVGGGFLLFAGMMAFVYGDDIIGTLLAVVGFILILFGVYSERGL